MAGDGSQDVQGDVMLDQEAEAVLVALLDAEVGDGLALFGDEIGVGIHREKEVHGLGALVDGGVHQRRQSILIDSVDQDVALENLNVLAVTVHSGVHQQVEPAVEGDQTVGALNQQILGDH